MNIKHKIGVFAIAIAMILASSCHINITPEPTKETTATTAKLSETTITATESVTLLPATAKDIAELDPSLFLSLRNNSANEYRCIIIVSIDTINLEEYALSAYYKYFDPKYVKKLAIIHRIGKRSAVITDSGKNIDISISQYVHNEDFDAALIGTGELLKQCTISKETGEITVNYEKPYEATEPTTTPAPVTPAAVITTTTAPETTVRTREPTHYLLNPSSMIIHSTWCHTIKHKGDFIDTTDYAGAIKSGYTPCGVCKPRDLNS